MGLLEACHHHLAPSQVRQRLQKSAGNPLRGAMTTVGQQLCPPTLLLDVPPHMNCVALCTQGCQCARR